MDSGTQPANMTSSLPQKSIRINPLKAPGPDSNYIDWALIVRLHLQAAKLIYLLEPLSPKDRPPSRSDENDTVCALLSQIIEDSNFKFIRKFELDAFGMWRAIQSAHEDQTSGGRIYWLHKLLLMKMEPGDDITRHIERMHKLYERLDSLVTSEKPSTVDDIYAASLIISLPPEWHTVVNPLLQKESVPSETIETLLKSTNTCQMARDDKQTGDVFSSKALQSKPNTPTANHDCKSLNCSFCQKRHSLDQCSIARDILSKAKKEYNESRNRRGTPSSTYRHNSSNQQVIRRATKTSFCVLGDSEEEPEPATAVAVRVNSCISTPTFDFNLDSGCSKSMTPFSSQLSLLRPKHGIIRLADDSQIVSSQIGLACLPFHLAQDHEMILVPSLTEPLLSIAGLCDEGCVVTLNKDKCIINDVDGNNLGYGERRGNLYYLPSVHSLYQV